jgi:cytoskeleton protein RodZ
MSIGTELGNARLQAGLTVAQVSQRTRIRTAIIEAIERDDFSVCGGDFYARGHIRAIGRVAGLDPEPLVREYDDAREAATQENIPVSRSRRSAKVAGTPGTAQTARGPALTAPGTVSTPPAAARTTAGPARTAAGTARMVLTGGPATEPGGSRTAPGGQRTGPGGSGTAPGWPGAGSGAPPGPRRRAPWTITLLVLLAAAIAVIIYQVASSHHSAGPAAAPGKPAAASKPAVTPRASTSPAARSSPSASPAPGPKNVVISLAAVSEPCWARLVTQGGTTVYQGIVITGSSMTWTEGQPVTLTLGNPGAVTLTVDGAVRTGLGKNPVTLNLAPGQPPAG